MSKVVPAKTFLNKNSVCALFKINQVDSVKRGTALIEYVVQLITDECKNLAVFHDAYVEPIMTKYKARCCTKDTCHKLMS